LISRAIASADEPRGATTGLEPFVVRHLDEHPRVMRIVFDNQQHAVALLDTPAIVIDTLHLLRRDRFRFELDGGSRIHHGLASASAS
jgi:hypothetical protein